MNTIQAQAVQF